MRFGTIENISIIPNSNGLITDSILPGYLPGDLVKPILPIDNVPPDKPTGNTYVNGAIVDETGQLIMSVLIRMIDNKSGTDLITPYYATTGYYDAWTTVTPDAVSIVFKAKGYNDQKLSFQQLLAAPDVIMKKGNNIPSWAILLVIAAVAYLSKKNKKKIGEFTHNDAMLIFLLIGGVLAFNVVMKILRSLGLGGDPTGNEQTNPNSAFNPTYWKQYQGQFTHAISTAEGIAFATTIHNAFSVFQDDFNQIFGVFTQLKTKAEVSFVADMFSQQYNENLLTFLTDGGGVLPWDGLSYSHLQTILDLVKKLPAY